MQLGGDCAAATRTRQEQAEPASRAWPLLPAQISTVIPPLSRVLSRTRAFAGTAGRTPVLGHGPGVGDPCFKELSFSENIQPDEQGMRCTS